MGVRLPWRVKVAAKLVLSSMPVPYAAWKRLGLFEHGAMQKPDYAFQNFQFHLQRIAPSRKIEPGLTFLEIGPGDSLLTALLAHAVGAKQTYLIDTGAYATLDMGVYDAARSFMQSKGYPTDSWSWTDFPSMLRFCGARYLTDGTKSFAEVPDQSVDVVFSHAVLEHVPKREIPTLIAEMRRVLRPGGLCSHQIDLKDHLGGGINHLRFSDRAWESRWFHRAGFYTNRVRFQKFMALFEAGGFSPVDVKRTEWATSPVPAAKLHPDFRQLEDIDLRTSGVYVLLRTRAQ